MGREFPGEGSPAGKPLITARDAVKPMGSFPSLVREGSKEFPGYKGESYLSSQGAKATQKGKFETAPTPGMEYRQKKFEVMKKGNKFPMKKKAAPVGKKGGFSPLQFGQKMKAGGKVKGC